MKAAASNEVMAEFAQQQLSRIAKPEEVPNDVDYRNAVTKALHLTAGPNFPAERLYDQVAKDHQASVPQQPKPSTLPAKGDLSQSFMQALDPQGELRSPTATFSRVLSSLSSSTAPPRKGSPNYINIVYHHGSSDANNVRGM